MAVVYDARCDDCGASLDIVKYQLDADNDLMLTVKPCEFCRDETARTAVQRAKESDDAVSQ